MRIFAVILFLAGVAVGVLGFLEASSTLLGACGSMIALALILSYIGDLNASVRKGDAEIVKTLKAGFDSLGAQLAKARDTDNTTGPIPVYRAYATSVPAEMGKCPACGTRRSQDDATCPKCGSTKPTEFS